MMIQLPDDLERFIQTEVHKGHFASDADAIAAAVRLLQKQLRSAGTPPAAAPDPLLGSMHDAADEMNEIVAEAMIQREHQAWRLSSNE